MCEQKSNLVNWQLFFIVGRNRTYQTLVRVLTFTNSVKMRLRTRYFQSWQMRKSVLRKHKILGRRYLFRWQDFLSRKRMKQTPAEKFKHSSRYAELKRRLHEYLKNCRLKRLPNSIWLFLLRNKRLHRNNKPQNKTKAETHSTTNDETQSQQTSRLCIEYSDLSECRVSDNLHVVCESTRSILSSFNSSVLTLGTNPITFAMAMLTVLTICRFLGSFRFLKFKWIFALLLAVAQKGGCG